MGLASRLKSLFNSNSAERHERKQAASEQREQQRQNDGLLDIALKRGRMQSFTPDDLPAFYRGRQDKAEIAASKGEESKQKPEGEKHVEFDDQALKDGDGAVQEGEARREASASVNNGKGDAAPDSGPRG